MTATATATAMTATAVTDTLDQALLAAHASGDKEALWRLYLQAGEKREAEQDIDAACFYFTHAFVFALEAGSPEAALINQKLVTYGREEPL